MLSRVAARDVQPAPTSELSQGPRETAQYVSVVAAPPQLRACWSAARGTSKVPSLRTTSLRSHTDYAHGFAHVQR